MDGHDKDSGDDSQTQDGIFSTPDLTVNNLPQTGTEDNNRSRITNAFANTDAGQRARKLNNAMGLPDRPVADDVQIDTGRGNKKSSKWPLIFAVILVIIAVVAVVTFVISGGRSDEDAQTSTQPSTINEAQVAYARYANYMLYGEEKDQLEGEYNPARAYATEDYLNASAESDEFWNRVIDLNLRAVDTYRNVENYDEYLLESLQTQRQDLEILNMYRKIIDPEFESVLQYYLKGGVEGGTEQIGEVFSQLSESENETIRSYYDSKMQRFSAMLRTLQYYDQHGCIQDGSLLDACIESLTINPDTELQELNNTANTALERSALELESLITAVNENCWRINARFVALKESNVEGR